MSNCQNNCNNCYYRGNAIGSGHHATCNYPDMDEKTKIDISLLSMASFTSFNETLKSQFGFTTSNHAVVSGWFSFPLDFDPVWIEGECKNHSNIRTPEFILMMQKWRRVSTFVATITALVETTEVEMNESFQEVLDAFDNLKNNDMPEDMSVLSPEEKQNAYLGFIKRLDEIESIFMNNGAIDKMKEHKFSAPLFQ
ncbi:MAG: hypothetical protein CL760_06310 [Chloroflexi bacterium]|nr:hypothetical protein [Chloroflexota bacterium]|tara:strand:+ start:52902 stop:53489 length:588 start_codon:yes stop_codon:yes gene_type:complete